MSLNMGLLLLSGAVVSYLVLEFSRKRVVPLLYVSSSLEPKAALMLLQVDDSQVGGQPFSRGTPQASRHNVCILGLTRCTGSGSLCSWSRERRGINF